MASNQILETLKIKEINSGVSTGMDQWINDPKAKLLESFNPSTGDKLASVSQASASDYETVVNKAEASFQDWRKVPAPQRGLLIRDLADALRKYKEPLGDLISLEMGKIRSEGHGEVQEMIDICDFAVGLSRQLYGLTMHSERPDHRMYEQWHPLGPIGVITAFNFPMAVWAWNAAIGAVCGDTIIWKPSEIVPLSSLAVQHIANEVMEKHGVSGVFNLINGSGRDVGSLMLEDKRLPLISFTGSTRVGRIVSEKVASRFGRTILELGGNNAIIVTDGADVEMATRAILFGAVGTAGQRCTTTRRIITHKSVEKDLTDGLVKAYEQIQIGDPLSDNTLMGPLVNGTAVEGMFEAIEQAKAEGGEVLYGGEVFEEKGQNFVKPTIIKMPAQSEVVMKETFAPILYVLDYDDMQEAIKIHNGVPQGLSSAIFTDSIRKAERFLSVGGSDCGIANVNIGTSGAEIGGAFGGEKETGGGRESGSDSWKQYMRRQTNTINWSGELPLAQGITFGE
ncbi:MAG: aldehyde dehydrogenase family protein [Chloroflexi bacterium]|nr:aldehyde dehydrogenase family protein [Chloroflexota bacterium]